VNSQPQESNRGFAAGLLFDLQRLSQPRYPETSALISEPPSLKTCSHSSISPKKPVDPVAVKLWKLKREAAPTFFTLFVDQDLPNSKPELDAVTKHSFADCNCSCETALRRFNSDPNKSAVSDGVFALSIMCSTSAAVRRAVAV
jgi:hypothetical protein